MIIPAVYVVDPPEPRAAHEQTASREHSKSISMVTHDQPTRLATRVAPVEALAE